MADAPELIIFVIPETLSDKSIVYNVHIGDIKIAAYGKDEARELAEGLEDLIDNLSATTVGVVCS